MILSTATRTILYPSDQAIRAVLPDARDIESFTAVPATAWNCQVLRALGRVVPSLMEFDYDWPIRPGWEPFAHQRKIAAFLAAHPRAFNLSDMGTGKTLATLWACDYLMREGLMKKMVIVSPLSVMQVWTREIFQHLLGRRTSVVVYGTRDQRREALKKEADFYIINHDGVGVGTTADHKGKLSLGPLADAMRCREDISGLIVDEASAYRDGSARRTKIMRAVTRGKPYLWMLTGTPTPNSPTDAWSLKKLQDANYPESFTAFRERVMLKVGGFKWVPRNGATTTVHKMLQPAIRFASSECLDLPPCTYDFREVEMSWQQNDFYLKLKRATTLHFNAGVIDAVNEAVLRSKLVQIMCGAVYDIDHKAHYLDAGPRINALKEAIGEAPAKILIFAPFTSVVDMLVSALSKDYKVAKVIGSTPRATRDTIFLNFEQAYDPRIIVADPGTMAHGITAVAASLIIWYGPTDKTEIYQQANFRINRPGQTRHTTVLRLVSSPIEKEIYRRLESNERMQGAILKLIGDDK